MGEGATLERQSNRNGEQYCARERRVSGRGFQKEWVK